LLRVHIPNSDKATSNMIIPGEWSRNRSRKTFQFPVQQYNAGVVRLCGRYLIYACTVHIVSGGCVIDRKAAGRQPISAVVAVTCGPGG